jgi:LuxR family maltose regulon positive regulatory protein
MSSAHAWPATVQALVQGPEPPSISSQLLLTKLYLPPVRPDLVPRRRLLDQVAVGLQGPLTLISAPPGFGKTSLFCAWRSSPEGAACRLAWLSLDPDDDDPARFLQYLTGALETAMPGAFAQVTMMFRLPQLPPIKTVLVGILNCLAISFEGAAEAGVRPLVLAFDDFHVIENPVIHEAIEYLLDPPLRLARMRARGQITEIHAGDLRFTTEESTQFLNDVMRLGLEPSEIAVLDARTEGWIAGLKLASLRLAQPGLGRQEVAHFIRTFQTSPRFAAEFLVEEVVSRQPPSVQEFLLCSSILERMCAPLCDAIRPTVEQYARETLWPAEEVIEHLTRRNLFIVPLDDEGCWYRYHHLFRDLLRARLAQLRPGQAIVLHRVASEWYEQQGLLKEAVKHAVLTKDWDYAAGMVERHGAEVLGRSDLRTLGEWCDAFPEEVMARRPALCVIHAWVLILSYNPDLVPAIAPRLALAESVADRLDATVVAPLAPGQPPVSVRAWVLGNVIQLRAAHMLSPSYVNFDAHVLFRVTKESMEMLAEAGDGVTDSVNFLNIAYAYMAMPDSHAAEAALAEARRRTIQGGNLFGGVTAVFYQAYLALCQGKLALV